MSLVERSSLREQVTGAERAFEVRVGSVGGLEVRPTRVFVWSGEEREATERVVPLADRPVGLEHTRRESTLRLGPVELRSLGNPLMTLALAGVMAAKRWAEADPDEQPPSRKDVEA
jgi:hypothetical protein